MPLNNPHNLVIRPEDGHVHMTLARHILLINVLSVSIILLLCSPLSPPSLLGPTSILLQKFVPTGCGKLGPVCLVQAM